MDLTTNIVINGPSAKKIYDTMKKISKESTSNAEKRKKRLEEFTKNLTSR
ncbi:hypothetical protein SAMN04487775_102173 [Treponema bryantii]|uniref:Uncharacterized protein n=1 Tax=Treponema bryantii TaxID=163 RepID=A0A1I3IW66_9SPIR|nr:hypothetical protein [Treponema bryantii]SFI52181.1 hypothetical protein SAMN04487775_102173 [Treponema bryantii]